MEKLRAHISVGKRGEDIAVQFLKKEGFNIVDRNVHRKWGELDIIAQHRKTKRVHIIEVKTMSGSYASARMHPGENLTRHKLKKLERTCLLYIQEKHITNWQLDAVLVWYDKQNNKARAQYISNMQ